MSQQTKQTGSQSEATGCLPAVLRLLWLIVGNVALFLLATLIAQRSSLSELDFVFWATVAALILVRYIDITRLHGSTKDGEPASLQHWRRYVLLLLLASGALWGMAHWVLGRLLTP